jgi:predicted  nucleic acid-binding Zn-ribbon protein
MHQELHHIFEELKHIRKELKHMSQELDTLTAQVKANSDLLDSATVLINGIAARIDAAGTDSTKLAALSAELKAKDDVLAAAVTANTPATV